MDDNIQEMYARARRAFEIVEHWPQEKADEMALAAGYQWQKVETARELARLAVDESGIGVYEDKVAKIQSKTRGSLWDMPARRPATSSRRFPSAGWSSSPSRWA